MYLGPTAVSSFRRDIVQGELVKKAMTRAVAHLTVLVDVSQDETGSSETKEVDDFINELKQYSIVLDFRQKLS